MCGRYASFREDQQLADEFAVAAVADDVRLLPPSWNVAPTDSVRMIVERADKQTGEITRQLRAARWGLVPSWAKDPAIGNRMINARVEGLAGSRAFARPLAVRRALLPADGYYEWSKADPASGKGARKQPWYIRAEDEGPLALAGLYEFWKDPTKADDDPGRWLVTATIVTRAATEQMTRIHDRQPLVLPRRLWDDWLSPHIDATGARKLLEAAPPALRTTPVSTAVNAVANDGPELVEPIELES